MYIYMYIYVYIYIYVRTYICINHTHSLVFYNTNLAAEELDRLRCPG